MPGAIFYDKDSALRQGITGAGSALGSALSSRFQQQALQQQQEAQRQRQQGTLNSILEWAQSVEPGQDIASSLGTLQTALQGQDIDPSMIQPFIQNIIQQAAAQRTAPAQQQPQTPFGKKLQETSGQFVSDVLLNVPKVAEGRKNIDRLRELSEGLKGVSGYAKALIGTEEAAEFNALGLTAIEPVLKILNPRGTLPQRKVEMIRDLYSPRATDNRWTIDGKLNALESFIEGGEKLGQSITSLYQMYGEDIPLDAILKYESMASDLIDTNLASRGAADVNKDGTPDIEVFKRPSAAIAKNNKGRILINQETGEKLISNGTRWIKYKG